MGKPFVYANDELNIDENTPFCLRIANDATPLDIEEIVDFYSRVKATPDICSILHSFAEKHYSWDAQMKLVADRVEQAVK